MSVLNYGARSHYKLYIYVEVMSELYFLCLSVRSTTIYTDLVLAVLRYQPPKWCSLTLSPPSLPCTTVSYQHHSRIKTRLAFDKLLNLFFNWSHTVPTLMLFTVPEMNIQTFQSQLQMCYRFSLFFRVVRQRSSWIVWTCPLPSPSLDTGFDCPVLK